MQAQEKNQRDLTAIFRRIAAWNLIGVKTTIVRYRESVSDPAARSFLDRCPSRSGWEAPDGGISLYVPNIRNPYDVDRIIKERFISKKGFEALLNKGEIERFYKEIGKTTVNGNNTKDDFLIQKGKDTVIKALDGYIPYRDSKNRDRTMVARRNERWGRIFGTFKTMFPSVLMSQELLTASLEHKNFTDTVSEPVFSDILACGLQDYFSSLYEKKPANYRQRSGNQTPSEFMKMCLDEFRRNDKVNDGARCPVIDLGRPSNRLLAMDFKLSDGPVILDTLPALKGKVPVEDKQDRHPFDLNEIAGLYEALQSPLAVFRTRHNEEALRHTTIVLLPIAGTALDGDSQEAVPAHFVAVLTPEIDNFGRRYTNINSIYPKPDIDLLRWCEHNGNDHLLISCSEDFYDSFLEPAVLTAAVSPSAPSFIAGSNERKLRAKEKQESTAPSGFAGENLVVQISAALAPFLSEEERTYVSTVKVSKVLDESHFPLESHYHFFKFREKGEAQAAYHTTDKGITAYVASCLSAANIPVRIVGHDDPVIMAAGEHEGCRSQGYTDGNQICVVEDAFNAHTLVHEYSHIWGEAMRIANPEGWEAIKETLRSLPEWDAVINDPAYANLMSEDEVASEVLAQSTEAGFLKAGHESHSPERLKNFTESCKRFYSWTGDALFMTKNISSLSNPMEIRSMILYDLINKTQNLTYNSVIKNKRQNNSSTSRTRRPGHSTPRLVNSRTKLNNVSEITKPSPDSFHESKILHKKFSNYNLHHTMNYAPSPLDLSSVELTPIEKELVRMVAERSHQAWYAERLREGVTFEMNPLMKPWSELSAEERASSLDFAEQAVKAARAKFGPLEEFSSGRSAIQPEAFIDAIAENAHEVWAKQRMDAGWTYGEVRDNDAKKHPMLIPYSEVPEKEKEKEYDRDYGRHVVSSLQTLSRRHYTIAEKDAYHMEDGRLVGQKGDDIFITGLKIKDIRRSDSTGLLVATYESPVLSRGGMWYALVEPETGAVVYDARLSPLDQSFETGDIVIRPYLKRSSVLVEDDRHIEFEKPNNENRLLVYDKNTGMHSTIHAASGTRIRINGETYFKITNDSNQEVQLVSPKGEFVLPEGFHEPISILRVGEKPYVLTSRMGMNYLLDIEKGVPVEKSMNMNTDQCGQFSMTLTGAKVPGMVLGEKPFYMTEKNISGSRHPIVHGDGVFNIITDEGRPFFSKDVSIQEAFGKELPDGIAKNDGSLGIHPMSEIELNGKKYCIIYIDDDVKESVNIFSKDGKKVFPESLVSLRTISKEPHKDTVDLFTRITICGRDYLQTRHDFGQSPSGTDRFQFEAFDPETGELYMKSRTCILPDPLVPGAVRIPLCDKEGMWQGIDLVVSDKGDITFYKRENDKDYWLVSTPEKFRPSDAMADVSIKDGYIIMQNPETGVLSIWNQDGSKCLVDCEHGRIVERRRFPIVGAKETYVRLNDIEIPFNRLVEDRKDKPAIEIVPEDVKEGVKYEHVPYLVGVASVLPADPEHGPESEPYVFNGKQLGEQEESFLSLCGYAGRPFEKDGEKYVLGVRTNEETGKTELVEEKVSDVEKKLSSDGSGRRQYVIENDFGTATFTPTPEQIKALAQNKPVLIDASARVYVNYDVGRGLVVVTSNPDDILRAKAEKNAESFRKERNETAAKERAVSPEKTSSFHK